MWGLGPQPNGAAALCDHAQEVYEKDGSLIAVGRVEGGAVAAGHRVVVEPGSVECSVSRVELDGEEVAAAWSGQHVGLALESVDGESVARGAVICEAGASATKVATAFLAKVRSAA